MIDELDRVEDVEVRAVAQLVRAVADFRSISYVLAFDAERVTYALGGDGDKRERMERGKAYLEKIVQLQIPIPIILEEEILGLIEASLLPILNELGAPKEVLVNERYRQVVAVLISGIITTPRDVRRLIGTFHAIAGMIFGEVDWVDTLSYCTLLVKAPASIELIRRNFPIIVQNQISEQSTIRRMALDEALVGERLKYLMQDTVDENLARLLALAFPFASDNPRKSPDHPDSICTRRALLTIMRLGLPPSTVSRRDVEFIIRQSSEELEASLRYAYAGDNFDDFFDRLSAVYLSVNGINELSFWVGVSRFLQKPDISWMDRYSPMYELVQSFANLFQTKVLQKREFRGGAGVILGHFIELNEKELMPHWLRTHIFAHRLFGNSGGSADQMLLSSSETSTIVTQLCQTWRDEHLRGRLIQSRWDLQTVYTMIDSRSWDAECKDVLCSWMMEDVVVDAIALMLFGGHFTTGWETVEAFCGWDFFTKRAKARLAFPSGTAMSGSVRIALKKGTGDRSR